ncbi:MAG: SIMPL domain-containing protein [Minisyncoccia bacterium]
METSSKEKSNMFKAAGMLMIIVSVFFAVKVVSEVKGLRFVGGGIPAGNTMSFEGKGEVNAVADLALVNLTLRADAREAKDAQEKVTTMEKSVLEFLEKNGIEKKDIKTESYNSYPKYDYGMPCYNSYSCRQQAPKVVGYEVSEYISVKVRDLVKAGDIVAGAGALGVSEISGPNFSIENEDELKAEARKMAIEEAKAKAETLAEDLGVRLVRIVNFSENRGYPMMYAKDAMMSVSSVAESAAPSPELPAGENKIISNVVVTYEIR